MCNCACMHACIPLRSRVCPMRHQHLGACAFNPRNPLLARPLPLLQNPERGDPPNTGLDDKADFSPGKQKQLQGYAWIGAQDPTLLDHERCELLLIAASTDVQGECARAPASVLRLRLRTNVQGLHGYPELCFNP